MLVRDRTPADVDSCVRLARIVHHLDGYPPYLPGDLHDFIASTDALAAWVAKRHGVIVGHVALHQHSSAQVLATASAHLKRPADQLGVLARLLVAPGSRRDGVGRSLLDVASRAAVARGLWPILDVATHFRSAIGLYENCGWVRAGEITVQFDDGTSLDEFVYVAPGPPTA